MTKLHFILCVVTWNLPLVLPALERKKSVHVCDSHTDLQIKIVKNWFCFFHVQPMRPHRPAPTSPCSLASSCWCHSWVWPCTAQTAGDHSECARSLRLLWLSTYCTWNSSCGAAGYGWPCNDWYQPQVEIWSLLHFFHTPPFPIFKGAQAFKHLSHLARLCTLSVVLNHFQVKKGNMFNPRNM